MSPATVFRIPCFFILLTSTTQIPHFRGKVYPKTEKSQQFFLWLSHGRSQSVDFLQSGRESEALLEIEVP